MIKGRVVKATGSWYQVKTTYKEFLACRIKGKLRLVDRRSTNPVVIGDWVLVEKDIHGNDYIISEILPRNNYIIRQSSRNRTAEHILAANIDQVLIIVSIKEPMTPVGFIDRFLVTAGAYHIPAVVVFNKVDLYNQEDKEKLNNLTQIYSKAGYSIYHVSAQLGVGVEELKNVMHNKLSLLSGNSGVGKSTLINKLAPGLNLRTGMLSGFHQKGTHTTTFAEIFELPFGAEIIDTPGIKEFGILDFKKEEVSHYFPEMERLIHQCRFNNCLHINEPGCAVLAALHAGDIAASRYNSYLSIIEELKTDEKIYD
jgi:ribosome biogenesis GTPase